MVVARETIQLTFLAVIQLLRPGSGFDGLDAIRPLLHEGLTAPGEWHLLPTRANRQPTAASYLRTPGDTQFRAFKLDVLRLKGGRIAEITIFGTSLFPAFGLPPTL